MNERIERELALLRRHYPDLVYHEDGQWVLLPTYGAPGPLWEQEAVQVCFQIPPGYVAQAPYSFYVTPRIRLKSGATVANFVDSAEPLFPGEWGKLSWHLPEWRPTADLVTGTNLLNFVLSFADRFREGA